MSTRVGTLVWGFLLLGLAALFLVGTLVDLGGVDPGLVVLVAVAALGALMALGGLLGAAVSAVSSRNARRTESPGPGSAGDPIGDRFVEGQ